MKSLHKVYPHLIAVLGFVLVSLLYFYPVLQGKKIMQSDIVQYTAMAKEQNDFRASQNTEPYWTNSAFGGMPTYQLGAKYPHNYIKNLDETLRFLPRPADYLFLYFMGFYVLLLVLKTDPLKAFIGSLAFGFSTYLIIILGVGHNAKAHAIAYMPLVIAGILLVFRRQFILGGLLTMVAASLEINANHPQMTYYLLFLILIIAAYYSYNFAKEKEFKTLFYSLAVFVVAGILAIGTNATNLLATAEYSKSSTRSTSELTFNPDGTPKTNSNALSREYITEYSYGIAESFNLIAPRLFGGSNSEKLGDDSSVYNFMLGYGASSEEAKMFTENYGITYWGDQPIVAAPAYIGAVVFFFCVIALFHDRRKIKYVFLLGTLFSLVLSWGKNCPSITDFFIDFVPMYDKFRAVSSIQVLAELCIPVLAIMGLQSFFTTTIEKRWDSLWKAGATSIGLLLLLFFSKSLFDFEGSLDGQLLSIFKQHPDASFGPRFIEALIADRKTLYAADLLRSSFFIAISFTLLGLFVKNKLSQTMTIIGVGLLMVGDLVLVDKKYVNADNFASASEVEIPFQPTPTDSQILQDTTHYRVFEVAGNLTNARTSYFHQSIGGYSAVKPRRIQQLFDYQISKNNMEVLNMLNVKYIIQTNEKGEEFPILNSNANGNAWFVKNIQLVKTSDEEMKALDSLDSKNVAVINTTEFETFLKNGIKEFTKDTLASLQLTKYQPNYLQYTTNNAHDGVGVFSEIYYKNGWIATIDGKEVEIIRVNYTLRGLQIPAGKHRIVFKFEPQVVKTGSTIALISTVVMLLLLVGGIYFENRKRRSN
jgi:hypothetical protein